MKRILALFLLFAPLVLFGQKRAIPVTVSLFNESTALPFTKFFTSPVHPGIQLGTEFNYKSKEHSRLFQTANLCYFYHNYLAQGIGLNSELGYEYRIKSGLAFTGLVGLGYMHTFSTSEEYTFSSGQYIKKGDKGNSRLYPSLALDLGYYWKKEDQYSPRVFIRYQAWVEYPYSPDFIPVMTHINLHLGVKFFIQRKDNNND